MIIYLLRDIDPIGGYFAAQEQKPEMHEERDTTVECRVVTDFPEDVWAFALSGGLPVDDDYSNDSTWIEWWPEATRVWARESVL